MAYRTSWYLSFRMRPFENTWAMALGPLFKRKPNLDQKNGPCPYFQKKMILLKKV
jgi:hypothetical protein